MIITALFYLFIKGIPMFFERCMHAFLELEPMTVILICIVIFCMFAIGLGTVLLGGFLRTVVHIVRTVMIFITGGIALIIPRIYRRIAELIQTFGMSERISRILSIIVIIILI